MAITWIDIMNIVLGCAVLAFWGAERVILALVDYIRDSSGIETSPTLMEKYSRFASAEIILRFASIQVWAAFGFTLALSLFKPFSGLAILILPDRILGLMVLVSYCGLLVSYRVIANDLSEAFRRLMKGS